MSVLTKLAIALCAGIVFQYQILESRGLHCDFHKELIILFLLVIALLQRWPMLSSLGVIICVLLFGMHRCYEHCQSISDQKDRLEILKNKYFDMHFEITDKLYSERGSKYLTQIRKINGQAIPSENILCVLHLDKNLPLSKHSVLDCRAKLRSMAPPRNPFEFNRSKFYKRKNIHLECFCKNPRIEDSRPQLAWIAHNLQLVRSWIAVNIQKLFPKPLHSSIIKAMILGDRSELSRTTRSSFSNTGSIHILAISGLHIAVLYSILNFVLSICTNSSKFLILKNILIIVFFWFYCILVGAPNSVLRACLMLSLYLLSRSIYRHTSIYNIIAFSAISILLNDPLQLMEISFQFSFLALIGIIFFTDKLMVFVKIRYRALVFIVQLLFVSSSAQILLVPLIIHYFNQFPNYYWLSNLIAIPFAYIVLIITLLVLLLQVQPIGMFHEIKNLLIQFLENSIEFFNSSLQAIEALPYSLSESLFISEYTIILLYLCILSYMLFLQLNNKSCLLASIIFLAVFCISIDYRRMTKPQEAILHIHHCYPGSLVNFIYGKHYYRLYSSIEEGREKYLTSKLRSSHYANDDTLLQTVPDSYIKIDNTLAVIYPGRAVLNRLRDSTIHLAILDTKSFELIKAMSAEWKISTIVTDASADYKLRNNVQKWCRTHRLNYHDTFTQGYYSLNLNEVHL